ncbi:MAG: class I SAM-dependent methyltransferase [Promethearchaeota archaeon]
MGEVPPPEKMFIIDIQEIKLEDFPAKGWILDIGGGGEGVIGRLKGDMVVAIDNRKDELEDAPEGPLKIVMDATKLQFLDESFSTVTAFFSMMYMNTETRAKVFQEVYRVLKPGGLFHLWDVTIPSQSDPDKPLFVVPLRITLPSEVIQTGYGVPWKGRQQNIETYTTLAHQTGFKFEVGIPQHQIFQLDLIK